MAWASTHNTSLKKKMEYLVSELDRCQKRIGSGYLSAFPSELFDRFEAIQPVWAPYYTVHKVSVSVGTRVTHTSRTLTDTRTLIRCGRRTTPSTR